MDAKKKKKKKKKKGARKVGEDRGESRSDTDGTGRRTDSPEGSRPETRRESGLPATQDFLLFFLRVACLPY